MHSNKNIKRVASRMFLLYESEEVEKKRKKVGDSFRVQPCVFAPAFGLSHRHKPSTSEARPDLLSTPLKEPTP